MSNLKREQIFKQIIGILEKLLENWEYSEQITSDTLLFEDLGFESIDVVAMGAALEEYYRQSFPFADFLKELGEREATDIRVGEVVDFISQNLSTPCPLNEVITGN